MKPEDAERLPVCVDPVLTPGEPSPRSSPFFARLVEDTVRNNPVVGAVLRPTLWSLLQRQPGRDTTFCGNDASAGLLLSLVDGVAWGRQLREEVLQCEMDAVGTIPPAVLVHLLDLEATLQVLLRQAIEVHAELHQEGDGS